MKPVVLLILDGVGHRRSRVFNAVYRAKTPHLDSYNRLYPHHLINASGPAVGLPKGYQGNSEVGHLTLGSGRILLQSLDRINASIKDNSIFSNPAFIEACSNCSKNNSAMHLIGLVQDQGVHAHQDHLYALLKLCADQGLKKVYVHFITDGRDSPVKASVNYFKKLRSKMKKLKIGEVKTIIGRYYAMDRDNRWDRTELAFRALDEGKGQKFDSPLDALKYAHSHSETDEFIKPKIIGEFHGIKAHDSVIFFNYRFDRARQLTEAFVNTPFRNFKRRKKDILFVCMTEYYKAVPALVAFKPHEPKDILGKVLSDHSLLQLRIAETEKYAHVTYFFNGEKEAAFPGEKRILMPSPKVATYDLQPEMSAYKITDALLNELDQDKHDVVICNFANGDMVGHTGVFKAAVHAMEVVDGCVGKVVNKVLEKNGVVLITADHGNCEEMVGKRQTTHTTNPVNFVVISRDPKFEHIKVKDGGLSDVAPTILEILNLTKPSEMTGESLIVWKK